MNSVIVGVLCRQPHRCRRWVPSSRYILLSQRHYYSRQQQHKSLLTTLNYFNFSSTNSTSSILMSYNHKTSLSNQYQFLRHLHSTTPRSDEKPPTKPSSKVEETANVLTEEIKEKQEGTAVAVPKRPLYKRIQDEILHYYHGFRLLFLDMKISGILIWKVLNGKTLNRREHKQLIRTTSDMFRLVPFSVFIIVPFMELLLPVFIKLFPGMLPSTFQTKSHRDTKMKAELKVKLDMAKFLQETLDEMAPQAKGRSSQTAKEFSEFINKIRVSGTEVTNAEIMKFCKLFEDEITLDSLSHAQLLALCRVVEIPAYGTTTMLRFQLRMRLRSLAADDRIIEKEGVQALNYQELQTACKARGMRAVGVPEERLRRQLEQWLQLSLHEKVPPSLLLLSRAMYLPDNLPAAAQLQATLSSLSEGAAIQTKAAIGEREGKVDHKTRIQLIKEEERLIKAEQQEAKVEDKPSEDVEMLEDAIEKVSSDKKEMLMEKEELQDLKEEMAEYKEDLKMLENVVKQTGTDQVKVNKGAKRLFNKLNSMISEIETTVEKTGEKMVEMGGAKISTDELIAAMRQIKTVEGDSAKVDRIALILSKLDDNKDGNIEVDDLVKVIEIVGRENIHMTTKQLEEIVSILAKEETLEEPKKPT